MADQGLLIGCVAALGVASIALAAAWFAERRKRQLTEQKHLYVVAARQLAARAEAAERARADLYRQILDALPIPVWRRADDLTLIYANAAYAKAVGAEGPKEALLSKLELGAQDAR
ncbi:MAG: PAS domain-containing protein, partial [Alphaproteobacteria bacterium]